MTRKHPVCSNLVFTGKEQGNRIYWCISHITPVFLHTRVSQAVWSGACIIKTQSVQLSFCTLSFSLVLKEDCAASRFTLFLYLWRRLFIASLLHQTSLFHSVKPILSLSLWAWWVLIAKYGDLWTAKCMLRYVRVFFIFA